MTDPLHNSRYSVTHAKRHIHNLETEIAAFFATNPYARVVDHDANRAQDVHKVKLVKPMPVSLPGIAFDALNNLRSALDQAGFAVAKTVGKDGHNAKFPFGDNLNETAGRIKGPSKDIPPEIFAVMLALKPYAGGNVLLWALNKACNTHKHEIVTPTAHAVGSMALTGPLTGQIHEARWPPVWNGAKNEMELARVPQGSAFEINFEVRTFIAFGEVKGVSGQEVTTVLNAMVREVESALMAIEGEARRLGLFP